MKVLLGRKIKRFPQVLFYTFSGLRDTNLRKSSTWSLLKFFRLSKIEKRRVSPILGSLKFHSKGPVQLQTGTNHSFLGFESKLGWTHPKDELIIKHMLSSSSLLKIKRYLPEMVGEKREEWAYLLSFVSEETLLPLLNTTLFIHLGWEILCLTVDQTTLKVFSRVPGINFESFITKPYVVSLCVQEVYKKNFHLQKDRKSVV